MMIVIILTANDGDDGSWSKLNGVQQCDTISNARCELMDVQWNCNGKTVG